MRAGSFGLVLGGWWWRLRRVRLGRLRPVGRGAPPCAGTAELKPGGHGLVELTADGIGMWG